MRPLPLITTADLVSDILRKAARWSRGKLLQQRFELITLPCNVYLSLSPSTSLCAIYSFETEESTPEEREWRKGFSNLASGAARVGGSLLDYAIDAPALNLISLNICRRFLS